MSSSLSADAAAANGPPPPRTSPPPPPPPPSQQQQQVPNEVTASLTIKVGDVSRTSRKQLATAAFPFLLSEGFDVFRAKANSRTARELQAFAGERHVREDPAVYIRPGAHSKQAELVELTDRNFEARVARSYRNFLKRKPGLETLGGFACEVITYVKKDTAVRRHRAGASASASTGGRGFEDAPGSPFQDRLSGSKRRRSLPLMAAVSAADPAGGLADHLPHEGDGYKTVRMVLNGAVVPVRVNVRDLLASLAAGPQLLPAVSDLAASGSSGGGDDPLHGVGAPSAAAAGVQDAVGAPTSVGML